MGISCRKPSKTVRTPLNDPSKASWWGEAGINGKTHHIDKARERLQRCGRSISERRPPIFVSYTNPLTSGTFIFVRAHVERVK
jgi:hypothetical protein